MKKWLVPLLVMAAFGAEGMVPLPQTKVALKTNVKVKTSRTGKRTNDYKGPGVQTGVQKDKTEKTFLSIEVRNMSPRIVNDLKISYQFYELQFQRSTGTRLVLTRNIGGTEKLVPSGTGQLTIPELKPLQVKVVETEPLETSYRSNQDMTKIIPQTKTAGSRYGGYIVEYFVGDELVRRDASSRNLLEAYVKALQKKQRQSTLNMTTGR